MIYFIYDIINIQQRIMKKQYCYICNKEIESKKEHNYWIKFSNDKRYELCDSCIYDIERYIEKRKSKFTKKTNKKNDIHKYELKAKLWKNDV